MPAAPLQCHYFKNVHSFAGSGYAQRLHDIEDLKGFGKSHKACPYYTARKWAEVGGARWGGRSGWVGNLLGFVKRGSVEAGSCQYCCRH